MFNSHRLETEVESRMKAFKISLTPSGNIYGQRTKSVKASDEVWILAGGSIPFLLCNVGNGYCHLISEEYVRGIIHIESLKNKNSLDTTTILSSLEILAFLLFRPGKCLFELTAYL